MRVLPTLLGICGLGATWLLWRGLAGQILVPADLSSMATRLGLALAWLLPAVALLWAMLLVHIGGRLVFDCPNPLVGSEPRFLTVNQRVITNTLEHMAVFVPALLAWAAGASRGAMPQVLALAVVFAVGRGAFWAGYLVAPVARAVGMAATLGVTGGALIGAIAVWALD